MLEQEQTQDDVQGNIIGHHIEGNLTSLVDNLLTFQSILKSDDFHDRIQQFRLCATCHKEYLYLFCVIIMCIDCKKKQKAKKIA